MSHVRIIFSTGRYMFFLGACLLVAVKAGWINIAFSSLMLFWCGTILVISVGRFRSIDGVYRPISPLFCYIMVAMQLAFWLITAREVLDDYRSHLSIGTMQEVLDMTIGFAISAITNTLVLRRPQHPS